MTSSTTRTATVARHRHRDRGSAPLAGRRPRHGRAARRLADRRRDLSSAAAAPVPAPPRSSPRCTRTASSSTGPTSTTAARGVLGLALGQRPRHRAGAVASCRSRWSRRACSSWPWPSTACRSSPSGRCCAIRLRRATPQGHPGRAVGVLHHADRRRSSGCARPTAPASTLVAGLRRQLARPSCAKVRLKSSLPSLFAAPAHRRTGRRARRHHRRVHRAPRTGSASP